MHICLLCLYVVLSCVGRGLCDGLITRPEESYRVSTSVWLRNLKGLGQCNFWVVEPLDGWMEGHKWCSVLRRRMQALCQGWGAGGLFGPGLKFKGCLYFKGSWRSKLDCKPKELVQKILELGSLGCFLILPSVCLHRWLQVNALSMSWNRFRTITVQLLDKIIRMARPRSK
jgi:hypothetical protein